MRSILVCISNCLTLLLERQKATRQLKKLRKRLLETKSTEEVEALKKEMYTTEVDLNYTQYFPLSEIYVSLYPPKKAATEDEEEEGEAEEEEPKPKPPMWAEVEKCMKVGTLDKLRNRKPAVSASTPKTLQKKPAKERPVKPIPKPIPQPQIDTTGMNRRQRRSQRGITVDYKATKNKSMAFAKNQAFGAEEGAKADEARDGDSDGGFFEE